MKKYLCIAKEKSTKLQLILDIGLHLTQILKKDSVFNVQISTRFSSETAETKKMSADLIKCVVCTS